MAAATVGDSVNLSCERLIANLELQSQWVAVSTPVGVVVPVQGGLGLSFVASQAGDYLFELQASAGGVATTRSLHLAVAPPPNKAPTLSCPTEVSVAVGQETQVACTVVDDGLPANATVTTQWAQSAGPVAATLSDASSAAVRFRAGTVGRYGLRLNAGDGALSSSADVVVNVTAAPNPPPNIICPGNVTGRLGQEAVVTCTASDDGRPSGVGLSAAWSSVAGPAAVTMAGQDTLSMRFTPSALGSYRFRLTVADGQASSTVEVVVAVGQGPNEAPVLTCPTTQSGVAGQLSTLACQVKDDGQPSGNAVTLNWTNVSGPALLTLSGQGTSTVTTTPSAAGDYRLKLVASDGVLTSSAEMVLVVAPPANAAPQVVCPTSQTARTGQEAVLACTATDDGLPSGSALSYTWTSVSGPAAVTLGGASTGTMRFTPTVTGTYRFKLVVSDGTLKTERQVDVDVQPPVNLAPVVSCPTATLDGRVGSAVTAACTVSDDGLPAGSTVSYAWAWVPGSPTATLNGASTASATFTPGAVGDYVLRLTASDGKLSTSKDVAVKVLQPAAVSCPSSLSVTVKTQAAIDCSVNLGSLPAGSVLTYAWTVTSTPDGSTPALSSPSALSTRFTPTVAGSYRLRLSTSEAGKFSSSTDVVVTATPPPNVAPVISCPSSVSATAQQAVSVNCTVSDDGLPNPPARTVPSWSVLAGAPAAVSLSGQSTNTVGFTPSVAGTYNLRLSVSDGAPSEGGKTSTADVAVVVAAPPNKAPVISCPATQSGQRGREVLLTCSALDDGLPSGASLAWSWSVLEAPAGATPTLSGAATASVRFTPGSAGSYRLQARVTDSLAPTTATVVVTVVEPTNAAPVVSCPASMAGVVGSEVPLSCTVNDDGLPAGSSVTSTWSVVSAPVSTSLAVTAGSSTRFTPSAAGTYRLRLTASDGAASASAETVVTITSNPNQAPSASCPTSQTAVVGQSSSVICTATDDGLPTGSALSFAWTVLSTPTGGGVTLGGASTRTVQFTPTAAGTYRLRFQVSDGQAQVTKDVQVDASAAPNQSPVVTCPTQVSGRANREVSFTCTVSDDGLPSGSSVNLTWSWVSPTGASAPTITTGTSGTAKFTPRQAGTYQLQLAASDGLLTASRQIQVDVAAAPFVRIQPLGASITQGYHGAQSYRYALWKQLVDDNASFDLVGSMSTTEGTQATYPNYAGKVFDAHHEGHSGQTTAQVAANLASWMSGYTPDISLVHVGTNDFLQGGTGAIPAALNSLTSIVTTLRTRNPNIRIYVAKLVPVATNHPASLLDNTTMQSAQNAIVQFNSQLISWAAGLTSSASPITLVDQHSGFDARTETSDGVHPTAAGEAKIAQRWFQAIYGNL